ncbi:MAG: zinc ribbon domain-containing protein [Candidatus Omnitrophica bacterium]|nr:zinc ribbon domain-containing protein [Candidatus Omnitrophota bacterium]
MPTYEYECTHCGHTFEVSQKITDKHLEKCPKCGKKVKRLIASGVGVIFKGTGFYATDYPKKGKGHEAKTPDCPRGCKGCPQ